jgi:hypothetical protein
MRLHRSETISVNTPSLNSSTLGLSQSLRERLAADPALLIPPSAFQAGSESPILETWRAAGVKAWQTIHHSAEPPSSLLWLVGQAKAAWLTLPGWVCLIAWPSPTGGEYRPALLLSDREVPSAGQILRLAAPWSTDLCLVPLPPLATVRIPNVRDYWVGAALAGSLFIVLGDEDLDVAL